MSATGQGELLLIRHAPALHGGRLCGRRDVPAVLPPESVLSRLREMLDGALLVSSPARRCVETAAALLPEAAAETDARLWEQDFGEWEGIGFPDLPDLGDLSREALAAHRPPGGESFDDMANRATPALLSLFERARRDEKIAVVAHAGTVRVAIGLALGCPGLGLAFEVAPLSVTRLTCHSGGIGIIATNMTFPA